MAVSPTVLAKLVAMALSKQLKDGETLEDKLGDYLDELCNQLPWNVYDRISSEIFAEAQQRKAEQQVASWYAAFKVMEHGETH